MTVGQNVKQRDRQAGREGFCVLRQIDRLNPQSDTPMSYGKNHIDVPLRKNDRWTETDSRNNRKETSSVPGQDEREE